MHQEIEVLGLRLSPQQKRLWAFQQEGEVSHAQAVIRLDGVFEGDELRAAIRKVVARHQSLRTTFYRESGVKVPFQVISDQNDILWQCLDLRSLDGSRQQEAVETELATQRAAAVEWERGPLVNATWCLLSPEQSLLLLDIPALCADRRSIQNFLREIGRWYGVSDAGESADEPIQYAQFSEWQNELLAEGEAEAGREWWAKQDLAAHPALILPFERPSDAPCAYFYPHSIQRDVSQDVVMRLEQLARDRHTSLEVVLSACWQTLVAKVTRRQDLVCWWRCDGRKYDELQDGIGLFEKWVPVFGFLATQMSVHDLILQTVQVHAQAIEWQEYWHGETNSGQPNALTDPIGFEYERVEEPCRIEQGTLTLERMLLSTEPFKLRLTCSQQDCSLCLAWHYVPDRLSGEWLRYLVDQYMVLLCSISEHANDSIERLNMVGASARQRLIHTLNDTKRLCDGPTQLHKLFEQQVSQHPDVPALVAGDRVLTYAELNAKANQVAHGLIGRGVSQGDCVGLCVERAGEMIIGLLGVLKAGAAYVPIDPAHAAVRLAQQMAQCGATILLTEDESSRPWPGFRGTVLALGARSSAFSAEPNTDPNRRMSPDDLAYVIYTSGSTGVPKGVAISHRSATNYTLALCRQLDLKEPLRFATISTLSADLGNTAIFTSLASGGCLHVISFETATDGRLFGDYLARHAIDVLKIVPSHFKALLATATGAPVFPSRYLILGGELLSRELAETAARMGGCIVMNHYGPTETTIGALTYRFSEESDSGLSQHVPIGRPLDNLEAYILDGRMEPVPVGVPGELYLGGAGLARGYLSQPDRTAERFVPHPYSTGSGARLYRTGDVTRYLPDGTIEFLGRVDHQVKIRGFRIELGEIETVLAQHPDVQDAVVMARESAPGEQYLVAYLVARESQPDGLAIQEFLRTRLPDYMIPTKVMCLSAMPLTANGKVDRKALPEPNQDGMGGTQFVAPRTATEEILAGIWSEVLKRDPLGIHDNFFDLGGHSLLATQVMSRLRQAFRIDLPLRTLFEAPSIARLAGVVDVTRTLEAGEQVPAIVPAARNGPIPLSFAQQRLWVLAQLEPDSAAYNIPIALHIQGPLDASALERSFNEVVRRHEILRTTFVTINGAPVQVIAPSLSLPLLLIDLQHLSPQSRQGAAMRLAEAEGQRPFDLTYGPLLRLSAIRLHAEEHVLLVTLSHIVSDAWSSQVLLREITVLYKAFIEGRSSPFSALPIQYADFSLWQRTWLSESVFERELMYWKEVLGGVLAPLMLSADRSRPLLQSSVGAIETHLLSEELSKRAKDLSRRTGTTLFMTLLAAFYLLLSRYSGQHDLIVGTPIANRNRKETEDLIGFFVNTLAMRVDLSGNPTVTELLVRVRTACLGAYSHQDLPFERLVEELQPARNLGHTPIFQVMFDLQNAPPAMRDVPGLDIKSFEIDSHTAKFDLSMTAQEREHHLVVSIEHRTDLFNASSIQRMLSHFQEVLEAMAQNPDAHCAEIAMLTKEEQCQLIVEWNATKMDFPTERCLHEWFERQVVQNPDACALAWQGTRLNYEELNARANQLAHHLRRNGVGPETFVGICMDRSPDMVVGVLAILKAGGAYVPIDPRYPKGRIVYMLQDSQASCVVTQERFRDLIPEETATVILIDAMRTEIAQEVRSNLDLSSSSLNAAYIIYTSGSTGRPKGVVITHRNAGALIRWAESVFMPEDVKGMLAATSLCFDLSVFELFVPLSQGGCVILADNALGVSALPEASQVTLINTVPSAVSELVRGKQIPVSVRTINLAGEPLSSELVDELYALGHLDKVFDLYGPSEDTTYSTYALRQKNGPCTIGRPISNTRLYILDGALNPVPIGVAGELYIGGEGLARGYWNRPELTADRFVPDPFHPAPGQRMYKTGDRVRYASDGMLQFMGRLDYQVKLRGYRIELGEVEAQLRLHPTVRDVVVAIHGARPELRRLIAYVVSAEGNTCDDAVLKSWLAGFLPEYMIPSTIIMMPSFPLTPNGKIDRKALPEPELSAAVVDTYVAPRTALENRLSSLWAEVLGVERVGVYDNFFQLGGHSLLAVQLVTRMNEIVGQVLPLMALFQNPTVADLASSLASPRTEKTSLLVSIKPSGSQPPLYCIDPTGTHVLAYQTLAHALQDDQPLYGLSLDFIFSRAWTEISIRAITDEFRRVIQVHKSGAGYRLLGWSNGGAIALALAQMLEAHGDKVDFLGLLDTQPHAETYAADYLNPLDELTTYVRPDRRQEIMLLPTEERRELEEDLLRLSEDERIEYAIRWARDRNLLSPEESNASLAVLKLGYALAREAALVLKSSESRPIHAPMHVWWSSKTLQRVGHAPIEWRRYTKGTVEEYTVIGDHTDAVQSIQVHQKIDEILSRLHGETYKPR